MFKSPITLLFLTFAVLISGCDNTESTKKPNATGKLGSLVVVADANTLGAVGNTLSSVFLSPVPHLPAGEPYFEILKPDPKDFMRFYFNQKLVLVLVKPEDAQFMPEILEPFSNQQIEELCNKRNAELKVVKDLFAINQHIVYLFGRDNNDIAYKLNNFREVVLTNLMKYELDDQKSKMFSGSNKNDNYLKEMKKELGMTVRIPEMFTMKYHKQGFWWFEYNGMEEENAKTIALIMHSYKYKDTADFSYVSIRSARDSVVKYHIPGELKGSYMGTSESEYYPPRFIENMEINKHFATRIRGWWNMWNMSMGGPFIRYVVHNQANDSLFAFEGFVYKPGANTKERDLRLIESIALTIQ